MRLVIYATTIVVDNRIEKRKSVDLETVVLTDC